MRCTRKILLLAGTGFFCLFLAAPGSLLAKFDLEKLSPQDIQTVDSILKKKAESIKARSAEGTLPLLTFDELYEGLDKKERKFLKAILKLKPKDLEIKMPFLGLSPKNPDVQKIEFKPIKIKDKTRILAPQYLPANALKSYERMMDKMEEKIGKRLFIGSGFRSSAYQLYSFVFYLRQHQYSLLETASLNALPGYSEHGDLEKQGIDFVNEDGVDDDSPPEVFEKLPEYKWLRRNAYRYGFFMSYPRGNPTGISFEPWHWHYED